MKFGRIFTAIILLGFGISAYSATLKQPQSFHVGRYQARAIWTGFNAGANEKAPVVILVPGSGPQGPRELIPGSGTVDGKDAPLFDQMAHALNMAGVQTLELGKPGVENLASYNKKNVSTGLFYDKVLYENLHWSDLINNLDDAVQWVLRQPTVNPAKVYILGHSEGTQVVVDYASAHPNFAGVILLGYAGENIGTLVKWQLYQRLFDDFISPYVDTNHDGYVSLEEAAKWPGLHLVFKPGQNKLSYAEIESELHATPKLNAIYNKLKNSPLYSNGIWNRRPIYTETAALPQAVYVFNGSLDEQTPPFESRELKRLCTWERKVNCFVTIVPGVGHGFSPPRPPRANPFLDMTVGPVEQPFLNMLTQLGRKL